jgi:hypothetical protein
MRSKFILAGIAIAAIVALGLGVEDPFAGRERSVSAEGTEVAIDGEVTAGAAVTRTVAEMQAMQAALDAQPQVAVDPAAIAARSADPAALEAGKAAAAAAPQAVRPAVSAEGGPQLSVDSGPDPLAPPALKGRNFEGNDIFDNVFLGAPPDPHGAVGPTQNMQVTNSWITVRTKGSNAPGCLNTSLNAFFGKPLPAFSALLFDPRAEFDDTWNRWIVMATEFEDGTVAPEVWWAISTSANPCGSYYIYNISFSGSFLTDCAAGELADYPIAGHDANSVIMTWNHFDSCVGYETSALFAVSKASVYNGLGFFNPVFSGFAFTPVPPVFAVNEMNDATYIVAANTYASGTCPGGSTIAKYSAYNLFAGFGGAIIFFDGCIDVANWGFPPSAPQVGVIDRLDTLDGRFQNRSTQYGDRLWVTHTTNDFGFATPRWYEIDTEGAGANTIASTGDWFATADSYDWNPSIAANTAGEVFITWSASDPTGTTFRPQVRFTGDNAAPYAMTAGVVAVTSPAVFNDGDAAVDVFRWGDYSQTHLDPQAYSGCAANRRAWGFNERSNAGNNWSTQIFRFGHC